jgi:hypothetical protein
MFDLVAWGRKDSRLVIATPYYATALLSASERPPVIRTSPARDADSLAREIETNLLPRYYTALARIREIQAAQAAREEQEKTVALELLACVGGGLELEPYDQRAFRGSPSWAGSDHYHMMIHYSAKKEGGVHMFLNGLSPEEGRAVLALLRSLRESPAASAD